MSDSKDAKSTTEPATVDSDAVTAVDAAAAPPPAAPTDESSTPAEDSAPVDAEPVTGESMPSSTAKSSDLAAPATPTGAPSSPSAGPTSAAPAESPVAYLGSMFPEVPADTLEAVLTAHEGSVEGAIESLLGMTDGAAAAAPPRTTQSLSQIQIDEALAKQLAAEDAHAAQSARALRSQGQPQPQQVNTSLQARQGQSTGPAPPVTYQAYVPRSKRPGAPPTQQYSPAGIEVGERERWHDQGVGERHRDELDELTENFAKLADQGKKTFAGLWGKAKEQAIKINQQITESASPSSASTSTSAPPPPAKTAPQPVRKSSLPSRYTTNQPEATLTPQVPAKTTSSAVPVPEAVSSTSASASASAPAVKETSPAPTAADTAGTDAEPKKDFSKVGLLPRQSISLLDSDRHAADDSDDDDLEYVKSPFDDD